MVPENDRGAPYTRGVEEHPPRRRLAWSTAMFSLATGLSRVLGLIREMVAAYYFGASGKINAFTVAFQVPNLLRSLVADQALGRRSCRSSASCSSRGTASARGGSPRACSS